MSGMMTRYTAVLRFGEAAVAQLDRAQPDDDAPERVVSPDEVEVQCWMWATPQGYALAAPELLSVVYRVAAEQWYCSRPYIAWPAARIGYRVRREA